MIDHDALRRIVHEFYVPVIQAKYGEEGTSALRKVLEFLPRLFERVEPELLKGRLLVILPLPGFDRAVLPGNGTVANDVTVLAEAIRPLPSCIVQLSDPGFRWWGETIVDLAAISKRSIVYRFESCREHFIVDGVEIRVPRVDTAQASVFSRPTFGTLREALQLYRQRIRSSSCLVFAAAWEDANRLFFKRHAEKEMRRSLHQFLSSVLRDAEVRPEQIVDETHPVDIKITWMFTTRLALVEIKWVGKSRDGGRITASHNAARANDGAKQLADYLDANRTLAPDHQTKGYLLVVDGRRLGLNEKTTAISKTNGFHYENVEIVFDPEFHRLRDDFEAPVRVFVEPICIAS
jgi:hypothetical protein